MTHRLGFLSIGVALLLAGSASRSDGQTKTVGLQIRSESWVTNSGFDSAGFTRRCAAAQVTLALDSGSDGLLVIEYVESKGSGYSMFGFAPPSDWGTNITYKLSLLSPSDGKTLLSLTTTASTPSSGVAMSALHQAAVDAFKARPQYRFACTAVAAALGSRAEAEKLLPWAVHEKEGQQLLEKVAFVPSTLRDRAFLAVAKRNWSDLQQFGNVAAEPLGLFIQSYYRDGGFGRHQVPSAPAEELADVGAAATALAASGSTDAARTLEALLKECSQWRRDAVKPLVIPTLTALGKVGNAFSLSVTDEWTSCRACDRDERQQAAMKEIAVAAEDAAKNIRARLVKK